MKNLFAVAALLLACESAPAVQLMCPPFLETEQGSSQAPEGWSAVVSRAGKLPLVGANFTDGRPEQLADLKGESERRKGKISVTTWNVEGMSPDGLWLYCRYLDTTVVLTQRLPNGLKSCEMISTDDPAAAVPIKSIKCR